MNKRIRTSGKVDAPSVVLGVVAGAIIAIGTWVGLGYAGYVKLPFLAPPVTPIAKQPEQKVIVSQSKAMLLSENTIADIASEASKSVVNIDTKTTAQGRPVLVFPENGMDEPRLFIPRALAIGSGSGIIIKSDGYVLTNNHVVQNANEITVTLSDKRKFKGKVIGRDQMTDLALVKIPATDLPIAKMGSSNAIRPGDWAIAIGSPLGLDHTVTLGIVSAIGRSITDEAFNFGDLIQTDAAINPGNSGGPLLNIHGEVIGINTAIRQDGQNIGFAIPVDVSKQIYEDLIAKGKVARAYVGVYMQPMNPDVAKALGVPEETPGVAVAAVAKDGPASQAGLAKGDIIQKVDGSTVDSNQEVQKLVRKHKPGESLSFIVLRGGKLVTIDVKVDEFPDNDQS